MIAKHNILAEYEGHFAKAYKREELIAAADRVPPLPHTVLKVLRLLNDPNCDLGHLAAAVATDAGLVAALIKLANSATFGQSGTVATTEAAVKTVGFTYLRTLVLATTLRGIARRDAVDQLVWEHALATAMIARQLAEAVARSFADEAFLIGLLRGLGQFVLLANDRTRPAYRVVFDRIRMAGLDYATAELEEIGFSHALLGALIASRWNFPPQICQIILHSQEPVEGLETAADQQLGIIRLADLLAHAAGLGHPEGLPVDSALVRQLAQGLGLVGMEGEYLAGLITATREQFQTELKNWS